MSTLRRRFSNRGSHNSTGVTGFEKRLLDSKIRTWWIYLGVMVVLSGVYLLFDLTSGPLFTVLSFAPVVAILVGVRWTKPELRTPWYLLAIGQFSFAMGDLIAYNYETFFHAALPFPSLADGLYVLMYPFLLYAGVLFIERVPKEEVHHTKSDILIVIAVAAAVMSLFVAPILLGSQTFNYDWLSIFYPVMDLIFLVVLIEVRLTPSPTSYYVLMFGVFCLLAVDAIYAYGTVTQTAFDYTGSVLDVGWLTYYACLGAAALTQNGERPFVPMEDGLSEGE